MFTATNLDCYRGQTRILSGVSFTLDAGDCLILRGPNGSGKTTLLRTLAGLSPAPHSALSADAEDIAYAGHLDAVKPQLSVAENLAFWRGVYQSQTLDTLELFTLTELSHRAAATLSAGQKRRLGLARLGVIGRKVLFLDEPTVSLDGFSVKLFARWLEDTHLAAGGIAVIATHVDLGIQAPELELSTYKASPDVGGSDEAFL